MAQHRDIKPQTLLEPTKVASASSVEVFGTTSSASPALELATKILSPEKCELPVVDLGLVPAPAAELVELAHDVESFVRSTRAGSTRRAYAKDWRTFRAWLACPSCPIAFPQPLALDQYAAELRGSGPVTAETVALFVAELVRRGRKLKTVERAVASIAVVHHLAGFESPTHAKLVRDALTGVRRQLARLGRAAPLKKTPITTETVAAIVRELDLSTLAGQRDAALICFGLASALRREELARLKVHHLRLVPEGLVVGLPWSKADQLGEGEPIPVPYGAVPNTCPVRTLQRWLVAAGIESGAVFRRVDRHDHVQGPVSPRAVAEVVKRCAARVGLDPEDVGGHSLRAGFATSAAKAKKSLPAIMRVTRHKDMRTAAGYVRAATLFDDAANEGIGL